MATTSGGQSASAGRPFGPTEPGLQVNWRYLPGLPGGLRVENRI